MTEKLRARIVELEEQRNAAVAKVRELTAENERLIRAYAECVAHKNDATDKCRELTARNAELEPFKGYWEVECDRTVRALEHQATAEQRCRELTAEKGLQLTEYAATNERLSRQNRELTARNAELEEPVRNWMAVSDWSVQIRDISVSLKDTGRNCRLTFGKQKLTIEMSVHQLVQALHSLCHVVMDDAADNHADNHADEHSSCHERDK